MNRGYKGELKIQGGSLAEKPSSPTRLYNRLNIRHLVSLPEFKEYLSSDKAITNGFFPRRRAAEISSAMFILKKRFSKYVPPEGDTQMSSIYDSGVVNRNRLSEMLIFFIGPMWAKIAMAMAEHHKTDSEILQMIKQHYQHSDTMHEKIYRMAKICDTIVQNGRPKKLLDIGVGNGLKTKQMQEMIGCEVYGADIDKWGPYHKKRQFPFKQIQLSPYHIPYPDGMFDCITLILVLHHATDVLAVIRECKRMLRDGGSIVIVEHDIWSDEMNMLVDLQHRIYGAVFNESNKYEDNYYNHYEWDILFNRCGLHAVSMAPLTDDAAGATRYDAQYIGVYRKL